MLYDILSPLIFFASLGGILLIVGRVVIRIRREQLSTNIRSVAAQSPSGHTALWQPATKEVTQLLQPTQKSVHAMRSRFALFSQMLRQSKETLGTWRTRRREATAVTEEVPPDAAAPAAPTDLLQSDTTGIVVPAPRGLRSRFASLKLRRRRAIVEPGIPREEIMSSVSDEPSTPVVRVTATPPTAVTPPTKAPTQQIKPAVAAATVVPTMDNTQPVSSTKNQSFASSLLRRVQGRRNHQPEALLTAELELENHHFQAAEDRLVPYIVKHPKDTVAYMLLGQAAMGREAWEEAMEIFEQVVKWNRKQDGAYAGLGLSAYRAGRFTKALQALQRSLDTDPDNREVLDALLSIAEKMDNPALQHSIHEKIELLEVQAKQKNVPQNA